MSSPVPASPHFAAAVQTLTDTKPPLATTSIYSSTGVKLIDRGSTVDNGLYERLMQHRLAAPLDETLQAQDSVTGKVVRQTAEELIEQRAFLAYMLDRPGVRARALTALETVPMPSTIQFQLTVQRDVHPALFSFSVCSALVAGWLASSLDNAHYDAVMLSAGGLLQDLGMMHVDPAVLQPTGQLTREQRRQLHSHPLLSGVLLERHHEYPRELIRAVREHHESLDGAGYPAGLAGDKISPWGKVLGLAQVVSALLRPGRGRSSDRLSVLLRITRQHDPLLSDRLLAVVQRLSDEDVGGSPSEMTPLAPTRNPVPHLLAMEEVLASWPAALATDASLPAARRAGMAVVGEQCRQMRRVLAEAGASSELLAMLGETEDEQLKAELGLIARELEWQMRALSGQVLQRWGVRRGEPLPDVLKNWLDEVESQSSKSMDI